jgi:organic radical activating enzyme
MSKIKVSEIFYSVQGEGKFVGVPSVFLRTFGCNFTCPGFGLPAGEVTKEVDEVAANIQLYKTYEELPLVTTGCDSYASWHPKFKHLSPTMSIAEIADKLTSLTPNNHWQQANGNDIHLVVTGGEPLLGWQRHYEELLSHSKMWDLTNITFETNGTQELHPDFKDYLKRWGNHKLRKVTFSVSAKLSASGERWEDAICPKIVRSYERVGETYLKFVVENQAHIDEVDRAVAEYRRAGFKGKVYIMPVGGVVASYDSNKFNVAEEALKRGYYYSPRLHVDLWGNSWSR